MGAVGTKGNTGIAGTAGIACTGGAAGAMDTVRVAGTSEASIGAGAGTWGARSGCSV